MMVTNLQNCDEVSQFLFCQSFTPFLPKSQNLFLMLRFIGVQELNMIRGDGDFDTISIWNYFAIM